MTLSPRLRKLALTMHVVASVGWLGVVASFLVLALVGVMSQNAQLVQASYLTLEPIGWFVLVPLSVVSLLTGLISSLGTPWGLFRHYWILFKLLINVFATVVLLVYMETLAHLADRAAALPVSGADLDELRSPSPVLHAGAALVLLLAATILAVYKPRGLTPYGQRKQQTLFVR